MRTLPLILLSACSPGLDVQVLRPAEIELPDDVERVLVADRAAPKDTAEHIMSFIEGVLTAEGIWADSEGRAAAVEEVAAVIDESPRFEVVGVLGEGEVSTSIWDRDLPAAEAVDLCRTWDADAVVALDAFDSDSDILDLTPVVTAAPEDVAEEIAWYIARRETRLLTSWEVYDGRDGDPLDAFREVDIGNMFDAEGETWEEALAGLPDGTSVVRGLALDSADDYGGRIAPVWETVRRPIYARGYPLLEEAGDDVRAGDLDASLARWEGAFDARDDELAGKCLYNAAVLAEYRGDLDEALDLAEKAEERLPNYRIASYTDEISELAAAWRPEA
jgi:hypothetical protein